MRENLKLFRLIVQNNFIFQNVKYGRTKRKFMNNLYGLQIK